MRQIKKWSYGGERDPKIKTVEVLLIFKFSAAGDYHNRNSATILTLQNVIQGGVTLTPSLKFSIINRTLAIASGESRGSTNQHSSVMARQANG